MHFYETYQTYAIDVRFMKPRTLSGLFIQQQHIAESNSPLTSLCVSFVGTGGGIDCNKSTEERGQSVTQGTLNLTEIDPLR